MNNITIAGQLGRDVEMRAMPDGTPIASFSVADSQGREKPTIWWNCQMFGKRGQALEQYLTKGTAVTVSGSVTEREWNDKDGQKKKSMDIRVNDLALQGGRKDAAPQQAAHAPARAPAKSPSAGSGFDDMDDDIPF